MAIKECPQEVLDLAQYLEQSGSGASKVALVKDLGRDSETAEAFLENAAKVLPEGTMKKIHEYIEGRVRAAARVATSSSPPKPPLTKEEKAKQDAKRAKYLASKEYKSLSKREQDQWLADNPVNGPDFSFKQSPESKEREFANNPNKNPSIETRTFLGQLEDHLISERDTSKEKAALLINTHPAIIGTGLTTGSVAETATALLEADVRESEAARATGDNPPASISPDPQVALKEELEGKEAKLAAEQVKLDREAANLEAEQHPPLSKRIRDMGKPSTSEDADSEVEDDPTLKEKVKSSMADYSATDAIDKISRMTSVSHLEEIAVNDGRVTVERAANDRLEALKAKG